MQNNIDTYDLNPTLCGNLKCNNHLPYKKRLNLYCSKSCAAIVNNTGRTHTITSNTKTSNKLKGRKSPFIGNSNKSYLIVTFKYCIVCEDPFYTRTGPTYGRKTCGRKCQTIASTSDRSYQNGSRKPSWYFNPYQQKSVLLDSSWEVEIVDLLCNINIEWIRPKPIDWIDSSGKQHLYYPDFYLPTYNLYLDPKNPYCLKLDEEKLNVVCKSINLKYGSLDEIKEIINNL